MYQSYRCHPHTPWARLWLPAGCLTVTVTALCEAKVLWRRPASLPLPSPSSTSSFPPHPHLVFCAYYLLSAPQTQQLRPLHLCWPLRVLSFVWAEDTQAISHSFHRTESLSVCVLVGGREVDGAPQRTGLFYVVGAGGGAELLRLA